MSGGGASARPLLSRRWPEEGARIAQQSEFLRNKKQRACTKNLMQALDLFGARSRNRTGTSLRTGDFKSENKSLYISSLRVFTFRSQPAITGLQAFVFKGAFLIAERIFYFVGITFRPLRRRMYCSVMPTVVCPSWSRASLMLPVDSSLSVAAFARRSRI